ncbi:unnamed protein product, partial [Iphiclides podalirius]
MEAIKNFRAQQNDTSSERVGRNLASHKQKSARGSDAISLTGSMGVRGRGGLPPDPQTEFAPSSTQKSARWAEPRSGSSAESSGPSGPSAELMRRPPNDNLIKKAKAAPRLRSNNFVFDAMASPLLGRVRSHRVLFARRLNPRALPILNSASAPAPPPPADTGHPPLHRAR